jgi:hypothetical protein
MSKIRLNYSIWLDIPYDVGFQLIKWVYTDEIVEKQNEDFLLTLMKIAKRFELKELIEQYVYPLIFI